MPRGTRLAKLLSEWSALRAFHHRGFSLLFAGQLAETAVTMMMMVALTWLVLEMTDSPLSLGIVWAIRGAPHLIWAMPAGAISDRVDRRKLLIWAYVILAVCTAGTGALVASELVQLWHLLAFSFVLGSVSTFVIAARQAFVVDIVGREDTLNAISTSGVAGGITGIIGGVSSGLIVEHLGVSWPFFMVPIGYAMCVGTLLGIRGVAPRTDQRQRSMRGTIVDGLRIVGRNRTVLALLVMAIVCEILGFSSLTQMPVLARDVLGVGATGLGALSSAVAAGGVLALVSLASLRNYQHRGRLLLVVFLMFGVFLILFGQSSWYWASLVLAGLVGAMARTFDTLQHSMLQLSVRESERGRAMGIWQLSLGFGPIGGLTIGAIAELLGAPLALTIAGGTIVLVFGPLFILMPGLRRQ